MECDVPVQKLNFESTVKLFANFCQHVSENVDFGIRNVETFWKHIKPCTCIEEGMSLRCSICNSDCLYPTHSLRFKAVYRVLGGGVPSATLAYAKEISRTNFTTLLFLGGFKELDLPAHQSHNGLIRLQLKIARDIVIAIRNNQYDDWIRLRMEYECVELVKSEILSLSRLREKLSDIQRQQRENRGMRNFMLLREKEVEVWNRVRQEVVLTLNTSYPSGRITLDSLEICCRAEQRMNTILLNVQDMLIETCACPQYPPEGHGFSRTMDSLLQLKLANVEALLSEAARNDLSSSNLFNTRALPRGSKLFRGIDAGAHRHDPSLPKKDRECSLPEFLKSSLQADANSQEDLSSGAAYCHLLSTIQEEQPQTSPHTSLSTECRKSKREGESVAAPLELCLAEVDSAHFERSS